jgi:hypothetical protein
MIEQDAGNTEAATTFHAALLCRAQSNTKLLLHHRDRCLHQKNEILK